MNTNDTTLNATTETMTDTSEAVAVDSTKAWQGHTKLGENLDPKAAPYTAEAKAALKPSIWMDAGQVIGDKVEDGKVIIYAMPSVLKVAEYGDKRWAWVHLAEGVKVKIYENSGRANALDLKFDAGKQRPVVLQNRLVVVTGTLRKTPDGDFTMGTPWIVPADQWDNLEGFDSDVASAVIGKFQAGRAEALAGIDNLFVAEVADDSVAVSDDDDDGDDAGSVHGE